MLQLPEPCHPRLVFLPTGLYYLWPAVVTTPPAPPWASASPGANTVVCVCQVADVEILKGGATWLIKKAWLYYAH